MNLVPFSGAIPSLSVSKNSTINNLTGGLLNNVITSGVNVAYSPESAASFLSGVVTPGLLSTTTVGAQKLLTDNIINSGALGPFGPLVSDLTTSALNQLSQDILGGLTAPQAGQGSKWFPGGGDEPLANYGGAGGYSYSSKPGGTDLVFQIRKYSSAAAEQATQEASVDFTPVTLGLYENSGTEFPFVSFDPTTGDSVLPSDFSYSDPLFAPSTQSAATEITYQYSPPPSAATGEGIWTFICAPEGISWETSVSVSRVEIFGNNTPPVVSGSRGMRELSISDAIVEGFNRGVTVEKKIIDLENLTKLTLDGEGGNVMVPVYNICAGDKKYGGADEGLFVIKDVKVKEELRDLSGNTTRARVDISFSQVPAYQVSKQRDIASKSTTGAKSPLSKVAETVDKNLKKSNTATTVPKK